MIVNGFGLIAYSDEFGHLFRGIPATRSEDNRPPVPRQIGHLVGAKQRSRRIRDCTLFSRISCFRVMITGGLTYTLTTGELFLKICIIFENPWKGDYHFC